VFLDERRVGNPVNPANQSLSGALARFAGGLDAAQPWWIGAAVVTGLAGLAVAGWAHRRGHRLAAVTCCGLTGLLVSPFSWTHHWVWAWPLLVALAVTAWQRRSPDSQTDLDTAGQPPRATRSRVMAIAGRPGSARVLPAHSALDSGVRAVYPLSYGYR
jgi:hypothetical protein